MKTIENEIIHIDGRSFAAFTLKECILVYSGGIPPILKDSTLDGCTFRFDGPARNTAEFIAMIAASGPAGFELALAFIGIGQNEAGEIKPIRGGKRIYD